MINYLLHLLTLKNHLTILFLMLCGLDYGDGRSLKMLNVIMSIYSNSKSKVKFDNPLSSDFICFRDQTGRMLISNARLNVHN